MVLPSVKRQGRFLRHLSIVQVRLLLDTLKHKPVIIPCRIKIYCLSGMLWLIVGYVLSMFLKSSSLFNGKYLNNISGLLLESTLNLQ